MNTSALKRWDYGLIAILPISAWTNEPVLLETITVQAQKTTKSSQQLNQKTISQTPKGNSSLDGVLRTQPSIQLNNSSESSDQLGEIAPANLSVHGQSFYHNQFSINGMDNGAHLNPAHNGTNPIPDAETINAHTPNQLPAGHPQGFWISNQSIKQLSVLDSNIPAKYGRFTGGVIDAELLNPEIQKSSGSLSYRQTRDRWTHFYLDKAYSEDFKKGISPDTQPHFLKQQFHLDINQPIGDRSALLFIYDREESSIPLYHQHLNLHTKQTRKAETFYLKGIHQLNNQNHFSASLLYAPHKALYFPENIKEGSYQNIGGGWRAHLTWDNYNRLGEMKTELAYRRIQEKSAYQHQNLYRYLGNTPRVPWISFPLTEEATFGGLGTTQTSQQELTAKQEIQFNPIHHNSFSQNWSAGWEFNYRQAGIKRGEDSRIYAGSTRTDIENCTDCIPGEQYFTWLAHIYAVNGKIGNSYASIWAENELNWQKFQLNLGGRIDYNQFLKNINFAPRIRFKKEIGNHGLYFSGGVNRYYGSEVLTYKLASHFKDQDNYHRNLDDPYAQEWQGKPQYFLGYHGSTLKTPYNDEINLSFGQLTDYFHWQGKWVRRFGRQQFMTTRYEDQMGRVVRELNNSGQNRHDTFSLTFDTVRPWKIGNAELGIQAGLDYQRHRNNQQNQTFHGTEWWKDNQVKLMVDGKFYEPEKMPALNDFNRPWGGYLATKISIPDWNFHWEQQFRYEAPRKFYSQNNLRCKDATKPEVKALCGSYTEGNLARYDSIRYHSAILTDWHFSWDIPFNNAQSMELNLDVLNVFNRKIVGKHITVEPWQEKIRDVSYKSGRQFWTGFKYQW